jgi:hypothetical protein
MSYANGHGADAQLGARACTIIYLEGALYAADGQDRRIELA